MSSKTAKVITIKKRYSDDWVVNDEERASSLFGVLAEDPESHIFLSDDFTLGFAFECIPLPGMDNKTYDRLVSMLNGSIPSGSLMQFFLFKSPDITDALSNLASLREGQTNEILLSSVAQRVQFLDDHSKSPIVARTRQGTHNLGYVIDHKLVISLKVPIKDATPTQKELEAVADLQVQIESALKTINLAPVRVDGRHYLRILSAYLHWSPQAAWRHGGIEVEDDRPLCEQIMEFDTAIDVSDTHLKI